LLFGIGSGAAMIPYSMIKEVNPDNVKGSATGAMNFLVFSFSAFLAPAFGGVLVKLSGGHQMNLQTFQHAHLIWVAAIVLAFILTLFLRETGSAARKKAG
jgi:MFS family permease